MANIDTIDGTECRKPYFCSLCTVCSILIENHRTTKQEKTEYLIVIFGLPLSRFCASVLRCSDWVYSVISLIFFAGLCGVVQWVFSSNKFFDIM